MNTARASTRSKRASSNSRRRRHVAADVRRRHPKRPPPAVGSDASAFNPAISLILGGSYTSTSRDPEDWNIAGFPPSGGEVGPGERSFNLGESELTFAASIDPYFSAQLTAAITGENEIEVEEAFVRTTALPDGFTAKLGASSRASAISTKCTRTPGTSSTSRSSIKPCLAASSRQDGVQVKWLAPTDLFVELGAEAGNGDGFPATQRARNGLNGATLFAHVGGDVGDYTSWRAGVVVARQRRRGSCRRHCRTPSATPLFETLHRRCRAPGSSMACSSGRRRRARAAQGAGRVPAPRRERRASRSIGGVLLADDYRSTQSGWYLQSVYQFAPRWRVGARYDSLDSGTPHRYTSGA